MKIDKQVLVETFAQNFLLKQRKERSLFELNDAKKRSSFINKLNHKWDGLFDIKKLTKLYKNSNDFNRVKDFLKIDDNDLCYVISNYDDIDDKFLDFQQAFTMSYGRGFATLIVFQNVDRIYLETEIDYGKQNRFVGKIF